jgi:hypothetical protein
LARIGPTSPALHQGRSTTAEVMGMNRSNWSFTFTWLCGTLATIR